MTDTKYLWERGHQWYLRFPIPRPLRKYPFVTSTGKPKSHIVEPLGDSLTQARLRRNRLVAAYEEVFARLRAGEQMTPDQIEAAVSFDLDEIAERHKARALQLLPLWLRSIAHKYQPDQIMGMRRMFEFEIAEVFKSQGKPTPPPDSDEYKMVRAALERGHQELVEERLGGLGIQPRIPPWPVEPNTETITQAAEAWFAEMQRDPAEAPKQATLDGHRNHVRAFIEACGDMPLSSVTRAMASGFLAKISAGRSTRTVNTYAITLACIFKNARSRGRFLGENPFEGQKKKAVGQKIAPFTMAELQTLFDSFKFEVAPKRHSPESASPWAALIGLYSGGYPLGGPERAGVRHW
jgi:hypothetical protein